MEIHTTALNPTYVISMPTIRSQELYEIGHRSLYINKKIKKAIFKIRIFLKHKQTGKNVFQIKVVDIISAFFLNE